MYTILLVDDEPLIRRGLKSMIERCTGGFQVTGEAENGARALEVMADRLPDVVISDIRMPDMDGLSFLRAVAERYPQVVTVVLSGYDEFAYAKQAIRSRVHAYLLKPLDMAELEEILGSVRGKLEKMRTESRNDELLRLHTTGRVSILYSLLKKRELALQVDTLQRDRVDRVVAELFAHMGDNRLALHTQKQVSAELLGFVIQMLSSLDEHEKEQLTSKLLMDKGTDALRNTAELREWFRRQMEQLMRVIAQKGRCDQAVAIERIKRHINERYSEKLSLTAIARMYGFNPFYLSNLFKSLTGQNFLEYVSQVRVGKSLELLRDRRIKIYQIAVSVGYENVNTFTKAFKRITGVTPSIYRKTQGDANTHDDVSGFFVLKK